MNDIRTQLPECPLEYEVPLIPGTHTALVIPIAAAAIDWQEKMLPWTLASLINNTDLLMQGVHLYIACEDEASKDRISTALKRFDLPPNTIIIRRCNTTPLMTFGEHGYAYTAICTFDMNYWAFRGQTGKGNPEIKLPLGHILRHNYGWGVADYSLHPANDIDMKNRWIPTKHLRLVNPDVAPHRAHQKLANFFLDAGERARWLHDANRAVYGEAYEKKRKNVAAYFFNETGAPNWHLDASILQYHAAEIRVHQADAWFTEWRHLGTDALVALYLLKTQQHAYNLRDSLMIERNTWEHFTPEMELPPYPRLCNMQHGSPKGYRHAIQQLMGAQLAMNV